MKFPIIKSCLARFSGIFAVGTPSNIHGTAISYRCAKFGAFVNSVTILTLRDLTIIQVLPHDHADIKNCNHESIYPYHLKKVTPLLVESTKKSIDYPFANYHLVNGHFHTRDDG